MSEERYRIKNIPKDDSLRKMSKEIEDKFATKKIVEKKFDTVTDFSSAEPKLNNMKKGEVKYYDDGTNIYMYKRVGNKLIKKDFTEVT